WKKRSIVIKRVPGALFSKVKSIISIQTFTNDPRYAFFLSPYKKHKISYLYRASGGVWCSLDRIEAEFSSRRVFGLVAVRPVETAASQFYRAKYRTRCHIVEEDVISNTDHDDTVGINCVWSDSKEI
ncbi:hypothetical protein Avbf_18311, partial [Armadillidium vulgare]